MAIDKILVMISYLSKISFWWNNLKEAAAASNATVDDLNAIHYLVIRQKGKSQNGSFKKTKHAKFSEKTNISYPLIRTRSFLGKFDLLSFLETPVLRFALLPYYRRLGVIIIFTKISENLHFWMKVSSIKTLLPNLALSSSKWCL